MSNKTASSKQSSFSVVLDPKTTPNDFQDCMAHVMQQLDIENTFNSCRGLVQKYDPRKKDDIMYETDSFNIKPIMTHLAVENPRACMKWDAEWASLLQNSRCIDFIMIGKKMREEFDKMRQMYPVNHFYKTITNQDKPIRFAIPELVYEKYITDVLNMDIPDQISNPILLVRYEEMAGDITTLRIIPDGNLDEDVLENKPKSYWYGNSIFDSFYMIPVYSEQKNKWVHIPLDLIISIQVDQKSIHSEGYGSEF